MKEKTDQDLSDVLAGMKKQVSIGSIYEHYKKKTYKVLDIALLEATLEPYVIYQAQYGNRVVFIRPVREWIEQLEVEGEIVSRFTKVN